MKQNNIYMVIMVFVLLFACGFTYVETEDNPFSETIGYYGVTAHCAGTVSCHYVSMTMTLAQREYVGPEPDVYPKEYWVMVQGADDDFDVFIRSTQNYFEAAITDYTIVSADYNFCVCNELVCTASIVL